MFLLLLLLLCCSHPSRRWPFGNAVTLSGKVWSHYITNKKRQMYCNLCFQYYHITTPWFLTFFPFMHDLWHYMAVDNLTSKLHVLKTCYYYPLHWRSAPVSPSIWTKCLRNRGIHMVKMSSWLHFGIWSTERSIYAAQNCIPMDAPFNFASIHLPKICCTRKKSSKMLKPVEVDISWCFFGPKFFQTP